MIEHAPLGIEDPYRPAATERFPRRPQPGDTVQIGFRTHPGVESAWVELSDTAGSRRIGAHQLAAGSWLAGLGEVSTGPVSYSIHAGTESAGPFAFEVGRRVRVTGVLAARQEQDGARLLLGLDDGSSALLEVAASGPGSISLQLQVTGFEAFTGSDRQFSVARLGLMLDGLTLSVQRAGAAGPQLRQPLGLSWTRFEDGSVSNVNVPLNWTDGEQLYGLGERFGRPGLRGQTLDTRVYEEYKEQGDRTYLPVPMFLSTAAWGLWLEEDEPALFEFGDVTGRATVDMLPRSGQVLKFHLLLADTPYGVTRLFTGLTGQIAVPPAWAFGPWMSANTWNSQAKAEEALERTLQEDVPATALVVEAWSDEATFYIFNDAEYEPRAGSFAPQLADFTFKGRWPDPKGFIDRCHRHGIRVILWQIPVLKDTGGENEQHQSDRRFAIDNGLVIRNPDGTPYRNKGWWFTDAEIIDFTNPAARDWWFSKRQYLFSELGIDGMKTDGGEHLWGSGLTAHDGQKGASLVNTYAREYSRAYHDLVQAGTGGDGLIFSRAGYTGAQTSPAHWAGDENSTWEAYRASIRAGLTAGIAGISVWGWDLGGFSGEVPTHELYLRGTAMAALCPVMQYHSESHGSQDNRERTPWNIAERTGEAQVLDLYREFAKLRMRLIDWLHGETAALAEIGLPLMRAAWLEFPQEHDRLVHDTYAYMLGRDLLVAPVVEKSQQVRPVLLPTGEWLDAWSGERFTGGGTVYVPVPLSRIPAFIRADSPRAGQLLEAFRG